MTSDHSGHLVTVVGLGPGAFEHLTVEALEELKRADRIYVRTARHPTVEDIQAHLPHLEVHSFDAVYEVCDSFEEVYAQIVKQLFERAQLEDILYAVPGSPSVDETTVALLVELSKHNHWPVKIVQGLSYVEPVLAAAKLYDSSWTTVVDAFEIDLLASENAVGEVPGKPGRLPWRAPTPAAPLLVSQMHSRQLAGSVKLWLSRFWPEDHLVSVVVGAGMQREKIRTIPLYELDRIEVDHLTALFVPPVAPTDDRRTFAGLMNVTRILRAPGGCPWDREQTHASLKIHLIEEVYEVVEALDEADDVKLREELGDLLFQIAIHAQIAAEMDEFDIGDILGGICGKLIRRHPHVFGDLDLPTAQSVLRRWESFKQSEKPDRDSILSGIPTSMPALPYSYAIQRRAANQGFEWHDVLGVLRKVREELDELESEITHEGGQARILDELGDVFFALVSLGRWLKSDPEEALRFANRKFVGRFRQVEALCREEGKSLSQLSDEEVDRLWQRAKEEPAA